MSGSLKNFGNKVQLLQQEFDLLVERGRRKVGGSKFEFEGLLDCFRMT